MLKNELLRSPSRYSPRINDKVDNHQSVGEAVKRGHVHVVAFLLQQDGIESHLMYRNKANYNLLHLAARGINPILLRLLVPHCIECIDEMDRDLYTPLMLVIFGGAEFSGRLECVAILLEAGAESRSPSDAYTDPLRMATRYGDLDMCRLLINAGKVDPLSVLKKEGQSFALKDAATINRGVDATELLQVLCSLANSRSR